MWVPPTRLPFPSQKQHSSFTCTIRPVNPQSLPLSQYRSPYPLLPESGGVRYPDTP